MRESFVLLTPPDLPGLPDPAAVPYEAAFQFHN